MIFYLLTEIWREWKWSRSINTWYNFISSASSWMKLNHNHIYHLINIVLYYANICNLHHYSIDVIQFSVKVKWYIHINKCMYVYNSLCTILYKKCYSYYIIFSYIFYNTITHQVNSIVGNDTNLCIPGRFFVEYCRSFQFYRVFLCVCFCCCFHEDDSRNNIFINMPDNTYLDIVNKVTTTDWQAE